MRAAFKKMHGLGNDFVIFDAIDRDVRLSPDRVRQIADRRRGIGCDQLIVMRPSTSADVFMEIWNADGSQVGACGNATRCVGSLVLNGGGHGSKVTIETRSGALTAMRRGTDITVDMGPLVDAWRAVPLAEPSDTLSVDIGIDGLPPAVCCSVGNPHAVFFVENVESTDIFTLGPRVERHSLFPERVNASFAQIVGDGLRLKVWERGAGMTEACGTAACAAATGAIRRGLLPHKPVEVTLDGGRLTIDWRENGHIFMTGPTEHSFDGEVEV